MDASDLDRSQCMFGSIQPNHVCMCPQHRIDSFDAFEWWFERFGRRVRELVSPRQGLGEDPHDPGNEGKERSMNVLAVAAAS